METTPNPIFSAQSIIKFPIFSLYKGNFPDIESHSEFALYLPTQKLDLGRMEIVAPSTVSVRLDKRGAVISRAVGGFEEIIRSLGEVTVPIEFIGKDSRIPSCFGKDEPDLRMLVSRSIIQRALAYAEEVAKERVEIENLQALCNTTVRELAIDETKVGRAYAYFQAYTRTGERGSETVPAWFSRASNQAYFRLGVVIERNENLEMSAVAWLRENDALFSEECKVPKLPGDDFRGLAYPLGSILRRLKKIFSSTTKTAKTKETTVTLELDFTKQMLEGAGEVFDANDWKPAVSEHQSAYANVVAVDEDTGIFLLVHKYDDGKPSWGTPGGGVEPGETVEEGFIREARIESGLHIYRGSIDGKLVGVSKVIERQISDRHKRVTFYAPFKKALFKARIQERNEIDRVGLFTLQEILTMPHYPYDRVTADRHEANYIKQLHLDDIITVLRILGKLKQFGCREATAEDYEKAVFEKTAV